MKATYDKPQINIIIIDPIYERLGLKASSYPDYPGMMTTYCDDNTGNDSMAPACDRPNFEAKGDECVYP